MQLAEKKEKEKEQGGKCKAMDTVKEENLTNVVKVSRDQKAPGRRVL